MPAPSPELAPTNQLRHLYRLSDPALSEMGLEEFLDELLIRVRDALAVDTVAILLLDEESEQLVARAAKGVEEEVERGVRIPIGLGFAGRIAAERVAILITDVDHADILNPILRQKGIRSLLGVPLIVEGNLIGVMHVGSLKPRTFGDRDLAVLQVAAARAAPGIERARLFSALEQEHRMAMLLQRSLLPKRLNQPFGVAVASRYLPASDEVGGDWYDVFELPRGRVGVAIGDVVGHGVRAAALMGQLRTALHAYAIDDHPPGRTLELVDRFVHALHEESMATAAYAVLDPETGEVALASAGHPPPLIVEDGSAAPVAIEPAPPLGVLPFQGYGEHRLTMGNGAMLVMYTDGLVERPNESVSYGIERLARAVEAAVSVEEACRLAIERLELERLRDDLAIVALERKAVPREVRLRVLARPDELSRVRRTVRRWLYEHGAREQDIRDITLAVNEACANAIEHAYGPTPNEFGVHARMEGPVAAIAIRDDGTWRPPRGTDRGRGLRIIETAMDEVSVGTTSVGTEIILRKRITE